MQAQSIRAETPQAMWKSDTGSRHSGWTVLLHWSSVLAIVVSASSALAREWIENEPLRVLLMDIHRQSGNFVLVALGLRLAVRFTVGMADHSAGMSILLRIAAQLAHVGLYALLLALPLLGLAVSNAHEVRVSLFGLFTLPPIVQPDADLADTLSDYHVWASWVLLFLVATHFAAACWHHVVRRDGVLVAMLPLLKRR